MLILSDVHGNHLKSVRSFLTTVTLPIQYAVDYPIQWVETVGSNLKRRKYLIKENRKLKTQQLILQAKLQRNEFLKEENKQLRELLQSSASVSNHVTTARILAVDANPLSQQVIINKGSRNGIFVGQPVLDANGILGQVIQVDPMSSRVLLITDPRSAVPVQDSRNDFRATILGNGPENLLKLVNVPETTDIKVGDSLVSSGLGLRYPVGYPVGVVKSIYRSPGQAFASIQVSPVADISRSRLVLLVWPEVKQ